MLVRGFLALSLFGALACDIPGTPHDDVPSGPPISIVGTSIDASGGVVPADGFVRLAFDRYLLPATVSRQSFVVVDVTNTPIQALKTTYDPVARTVTILGPRGLGSAWLVPDQLYKLVLPVPTDPASDTSGLRAIDRATLRPGQRRSFVFRAGPPAGVTELEPRADFCADVLPLFVERCARCHGSAAPAAAGLALDTPEAIRLTARGRVAQGSSRSARADAPEPSPRLFGTDMEIVKPWDPGSSWLLYKIELAPVPAPGRQIDAERAILSEHILGGAMPAAGNGEPEQALRLDERDRLRRWITQGAEVRACGSHP